MFSVSSPAISLTPSPSVMLFCSFQSLVPMVICYKPSNYITSYPFIISVLYSEYSQQVLFLFPTHLLDIQLSLTLPGPLFIDPTKFNCPSPFYILSALLSWICFIVKYNYCITYTCVPAFTLWYSYCGKTTCGIHPV